MNKFAFFPVILFSIFVCLSFLVPTVSAPSVVTCHSNSIIGDANGDGQITEADAEAIMNVYLGVSVLPENICCIDTNKNGEVTPGDAQLVYDIISGATPTEFCESEPCTDSDGGKNYFTKGVTIANFGHTYLDEMKDSCMLLQSGEVENGYCVSTCSWQPVSECHTENCYLDEYFINEAKGECIGEGYNIKCSNGCKDGACVQTGKWTKVLQIRHSGSTSNPNAPGILEYGDIEKMRDYANNGEMFIVKANIQHYPNNQQYFIPGEDQDLFEFYCSTYDYFKTTASVYGGWIQCTKKMYDVEGSYYYDQAELLFSIPMTNSFNGEKVLASTRLYKDYIYKVSDSLFVSYAEVYISDDLECEWPNGCCKTEADCPSNAPYCTQSAATEGPALGLGTCDPGYAGHYCDKSEGSEDCMSGYTCNYNCDNYEELSWCSPMIGDGESTPSSNIRCESCYEENGICTTKGKCTDTDNGKDYYTKGSKFYNGLEYPDICSLNPQFAGGHIIYDAGKAVQRCSGDNCYLVENFCPPGYEENPNQYFHEGYVCPNGCMEGACIQYASNQTCTDSDGGRDYYEKGTTTNPPPQYTGYWTDECVTPVTLQEGTCIEDLGVHTYDCPNGCEYGACIQYASNQTCTDSDGGRNYYEYGKACSGEKCYSDYCQDGKYLYEIDCGWNNGIPTQDGCGHSGLGGCRYECPNECSDGACIENNIVCGNGKCELGESWSSCSQDCKKINCPTRINLDFNKNTYYSGDYVEYKVTIFDEYGNLMPYQMFNYYAERDDLTNSGSVKYYTDSNGIYKYSTTVPHQPEIEGEWTFIVSVNQEECAYISDKETINIVFDDECGDGFCSSTEKELICDTVCAVEEEAYEMKTTSSNTGIAVSGAMVSTTSVISSVPESPTYCITYCHVKCQRDCTPSCGNGICDDIVCMAEGCPVPENEENCPADCKQVNYCGQYSSDPSCVCKDGYVKEKFEAPCGVVPELPSSGGGGSGGSTAISISGMTTAVTYTGKTATGFTGLGAPSDWELRSDGTLHLKLWNSKIATQVKIKSIEAKLYGYDTITFNTIGCNGEGTYMEIGPGGSAVIEEHCPSIDYNLNWGEEVLKTETSYTLDITILYNSGGYDHIDTGTLTGPVRKLECTDYDGGRNYYIKGTLSGTADWTSWVIIDDCCIKDGTTDRQCVSESNTLEEQYCLNTMHAAEMYVCPNGCVDGACIFSETEDCGIELINGEFQDTDGDGCHAGIDSDCGSIEGVMNPTPEVTCFNGVDDDCDGMIDENDDDLSCNLNCGDYICGWYERLESSEYYCPEDCIENSKEQVKCVFRGSNSVEKCYSADSDGGKFSCSGIGTCVTDVYGTERQKITWKSSCGGYAYTTIDGINEYAEFDCIEQETCTYYRCVPSYTHMYLHTNKNAYSIGEVVKIESNYFDIDQLEDKQLEVSVKNPYGDTETITLSVSCNMGETCSCRTGYYCPPCETKSRCRYTGIYTGAKAVGEYSYSWNTGTGFFKVYDQDVLGKYLILENIQNYIYKESTFFPGPSNVAGYMAIYEKYRKPYTTIVYNFETREQLEKMLADIFIYSSPNEKKINGEYIYVMSNYGQSVYFWTHKTFLIGIIGYEPYITTTALSAVVDYTKSIVAPPVEIVHSEGVVLESNEEIPLDSDMFTGMIAADIPVAEPLPYCGGDSTDSKCGCSEDEHREEFKGECTNYGCEIHYRCISGEPTKLIEAYLDKYPSDIKATGTECEEMDGHCIYFQSPCKDGFEISGFGCQTRSEVCCIKEIEREDILEMVMKLEGIRAKMDILERKANALSEYYYSIDDIERSNKFNKAAKMFSEVKEIVDNTISKIRNNLENLEEVRIEIKNSIKILRDFMKSILEIMVS